MSFFTAYEKSIVEFARKMGERESKLNKSYLAKPGISTTAEADSRVR